jgi:UDP-N-acetylglucosamine transferase subunit ALG13
MKTFVTLGFERRPFERLLKAVDEGIVARIIPPATLVQRGHTPYTLRQCPSVPFLSYAEMRAALGTAEIIIAHAGVGTLLQCLRLNKVPIIFPRSARKGEHVDDHQLIFARIMQEQKRALVALDGEQLLEIYQGYHRRIADLGEASNGSGAARLCGYLEGRLRDFAKEPD